MMRDHRQVPPVPDLERPPAFHCDTPVLSLREIVHLAPTISPDLPPIRPSLKRTTGCPSARQ